MIATRIGALVAWGLAVVLGILLALDLRRDTGVPDRALVPGFDSARVASLSWDGGGKPIRIERDKIVASGWKWIDPPGEADRQTVEDLLAAVRGGRWHRRAEVSAAGTIGRTLVVEGGGDIQTFGIGAELGEQQWIVVGGEHAVLVDRWVVRALAPEPVALRIHRPLAGIAAATKVEIGSFELTGSPRRLTRLASLPVELVVKPQIADALERALAEVVVVAVPYGKLPVDTNFRGTRFAFDGALVAVEMGRCPDGDPTHHAIVGPVIGPSCITEDAWLRVLGALAAFEIGGEPGARLKRLVELADGRPIGALEPIGIALADGSMLELAKRPRIKDPKQPAARDADPARVAELISALQAAGKPVALPAAAPVGHLEVSAPHDRKLAIDFYPGSVVARHGEPVALELDPGAYALLTRPGAGYLEPTMWLEDPLGIQKLQIGDKLYTRAKVVGEWLLAGAAFNADKLDALVGKLASPRALGPAAVAATAIKIRIETAPPVGAPVVHAISIGRGANLCVAIENTSSVAVDPEICDLVDALK